MLKVISITTRMSQHMRLGTSPKGLDKHTFYPPTKSEGYSFGVIPPFRPSVHTFYTPPLKCGEVLCYTLRCLSVCPSVRPFVRLSVRPYVRPCSPFPIDNLSIYSRNFFKFCIHIVIGDEWYGIVNGLNPSIFNGVTALFRIGKMVSGLLFLYYS